MFNKLISDYKGLLFKAFESIDDSLVSEFISEIINVWKHGKSIYICGNGGSAANAMHMANDFLYGASSSNGKGIDVEALSSNFSVISCLANDISYEEIYSKQIETKMNSGDLLIVLSGSGNSPNVVKAIKEAKKKDAKVCSITGYDGGICKTISDIAIHIPISDMQIAEDMQLIIGHICMKHLSNIKF